MQPRTILVVQRRASDRARPAKRWAAKTRPSRVLAPVIARGLGMLAALAAILVACASSAPVRTATAQVNELSVPLVTLTYADLAAGERFFREVLGAELVNRQSVPDAVLRPLAGPSTPSTDRVRLRFGDERIELVRLTDARARPYPEDAHSNDLDFQHLALVTRDIDAAYERVRAAGVRSVSAGPQRIPDTNPAAGGIRAFYFRDAEGHPLELIWYPEGRGDPRWQTAAGDGAVIGIDHTAIAVSDTEASRRFYVEGLGLSVAGESFNEGIEQERLSGVEGARVRITGLRGASGIGVEFLQYVAPGPGERRSGEAGDASHWEIVLMVPDLDATAARLRAIGVEVPAPGTCGACPAGQRAYLVRDPDGHFVRVVGV